MKTGSKNKVGANVEAQSIQMCHIMGWSAIEIIGHPCVVHLWLKNISSINLIQVVVLSIYVT